MQNTQQQRVTKKQSRLTQAVAREYVRLLGGRLRRTSAGDFRLAFGLGDQCHEYFTDWLDDVILTARAMQGSHENIAMAENYLSAMLGADALTLGWTEVRS